MDLISEIECKNVLKNFIKMGISIICYLRNLFSESVFEDAKIGDLHLKRLTRSIPESSDLIDWIDYGIYDTIIKEYLKTLIISIHDDSSNPIESYYLSLSGIKKSSNTNGSNIKKDVIKNNTVKVDDNIFHNYQSLRELILVIQSLSPLYDYSFLSIKLLYFEDTPEDYEPKYFRSDNNNTINMPSIPITKLNNGYNNVVIELYTLANINEYSTNYLTKSTNKYNSTYKDSSSNILIDDSDVEDITGDKLIVDLLDKSESLCKKHKFVNKSIITTGMGINVSIAKVLIKKLIEKDVLDIKYIKNKGYKSKLHLKDKS